MHWLYAILLGYAFGSTPTAWIICRIFYGINILECGSKNMGSTNVYRTVGGKAFAATLAIDVLKGMVPVLLSCHIWPATLQLSFAAAVGAMLGHTFSFWVKFKGGKGVATGLGVFIALTGGYSLYSLGTFLVVLLITRMVSVSSIIAAASLPVYLWQGKVFGPYNSHIVIFSAIAASLVIIRHKSNIKRIIGGTESKLPLFVKKDANKDKENTEDKK